MPAWMFFCCFAVLELTLMTTTFGARIFRRAGKYHVGRGVAYTDDCEFPAFQVGGSYIWKKEVCRKSNRVIQKYVNSNVLRANILIIPAARATFSKNACFLQSGEGGRTRVHRMYILCAAPTRIRRGSPGCQKSKELQRKINILVISGDPPKSSPPSTPPPLFLIY